jgi:hypothetical protein
MVYEMQGGSQQMVYEMQGGSQQMVYEMQGGSQQAVHISHSHNAHNQGPTASPTRNRLKVMSDLTQFTKFTKTLFTFKMSCGFNVSSCATVITK